MNIAKQHRAALVTLIAALLAPTVHAADQGWYVSAGLGLAKSDISKSDLDAEWLDPLARAFQDAQYEGWGTFDSASSNLDDSDTAWDLMFGYRFNPYMAIEGGYVNLGTSTYNDSAHFTYYPFVFSSQGGDTYSVRDHVRFKSSGFVLAAVGGVPIGRHLGVHGRLGLYRAQTKFNSTWDYVFTSPELATDSRSGIPIDSFSANTTEFLYGIGASLNVGERWRISLDWTRYDSVGDQDKTGEANVDTLGLKGAFYLASQRNASKSRKAAAGWYVTAGFGQSSIDVSQAEADALVSQQSFFLSSSLDDSGNTFSIGGGYKVNRNFAVEGTYVQLGTAKYQGIGDLGGPSLDLSLKYKSSGIALSGIGSISLGDVADIHGRLGMYFASNKVDIEATAFTTVSESSSGTTQEFLFGAGADFRLTSRLSLGVDWTRYNNVGDDNDTPEANFDVLSLSGKVHF